MPSFEKYISGVLLKLRGFGEAKGLDKNLAEIRFPPSRKSREKGGAWAKSKGGATAIWEFDPKGWAKGRDNSLAGFWYAAALTGGWL